MDFPGTVTVNAPKLPENLTWLNSPPLSMEELKGRVVLIDFWTYSCINCQRTLPYLKKWWDKYRDSGLSLIGVHAPEFEFEKTQENVKKALEKYEQALSFGNGVDWPIVLDNDMEIWQSYANHYWPAKYLINHEGKIIYTHFGEGNYIETELHIQEALREAGFKVSDKTVGGSDQSFFESGQTPELYFGSLRGQVTNIPSDLSIQPDQIYSLGQWTAEKEYLQHARETEDLDDLIILNFKAKDVYLVMESEDGSPIKVYITLDGVGLNSENAGKDVEFEDAGVVSSAYQEDRSYVEIRFSTLYHIISTQTFGDHTLRLSTTSNKLRLYALTFGS